MPNWTKEQIEAINKKGSNIIVSASAGSGKTAVLSERVIEKLKQGISIDSLLILTFTKLAASEMKERIRKKIVNEKLYTQLDKIDIANITTFDAYALSIVKKYGYRLNVSSNLSIIESSIISIKKEKVLDTILENLYKEKNNKFLKLINDFCSKDDASIKEFILQINNKLDMIYNLDEYLDVYISKYYSDSFIDNCIKEFECLLVEKLNNINSLIKEISLYTEGSYIEALYNAFNDNLSLTKYDDIKSISIKLPNLPKNSMEQAKTIKKQISDLIKEIDNLCIYSSSIEIKESILKTRDYVEVIIDIIKELNKQINDYKFNLDKYEFNDISKLAIKLVKENADIRNEIKRSLNEILIDEYQDTNDLQELFISIIENNNVYMVGDIKQSIYRFRNANPVLFKTKYDNYSNLNGGIKIDLNKNFRSRKEVISNINVIFNSIMDDIIGGADYVNSHQMAFGNSIYENNKLDNQSNDLTIYNYKYNKTSEYKKEEIEAFIIANDIKNKINNSFKVLDKETNSLRDIKYNDISILMDRSTNFNLYKKVFEYLNIPLTIYKDEELTDSVDISILKNIINLILENSINESYKYSFMSILRSYLFNIDDQSIFNYFINNSFKDSELIKIINSIDKSKNIKDIVIDIIDKFNFYDKIITVGNIEDHVVAIEYIINIASSLNTMGYTLTDFYEYLSILLNDNDKYKINYSTSKNEDGIKLMTIHASKGLEYSICYFSGMYSKFNISEMKEKFLYDSKYGIISPLIDNGIKNTIYKYLAKNKYLKEEISEKIRLLYVAFTRAKEKIIIVAPIEDKDNNLSLYTKLNYNSFLSIINSISKTLNPYMFDISIEELNLTKDYEIITKKDYSKLISSNNTRLNINELEIRNDCLSSIHMSKENHKLYDCNTLKSINLGKKIHSILENMDFNNPDYSKMDIFVKNKIEKLINTGIFNNSTNVFKEHEFIYEKDSIRYHGIIDLLIEYEDYISIVDYKLKSIKDAAYINQLKGYKDYVNKISNKKVVVYLYSIIDEKLEKIDI